MTLDKLVCVVSLFRCSNGFPIILLFCIILQKLFYRTYCLVRALQNRECADLDTMLFYTPSNNACSIKIKLMRCRLCFKQNKNNFSKLGSL